MSEQTSTPTPIELLDANFKSLYAELACGKQVGLQDSLKGLQKTFKAADRQNKEKKKRPQAQLSLQARHRKLHRR